MATYKFKKETNYASFVENNGTDGEEYTIVELQALHSSGTNAVVGFDGRRVMIGPADTLYINDVVFNGTAKEKVAELRDEVFLKPNAGTGGSGEFAGGATSNDVEVTDDNKGYIMKAESGNRYRMTIQEDADGNPEPVFTLIA